MNSDAMQMLHQMMVIVMAFLTLANLGVIGVVLFQHRLMWRDYRRTHKMNGEPRKDGA